MRWKNIKNRIIDFFYKEVEVEEEVYTGDAEEELPSSSGAEAYRMTAIEDETKRDIKVRYQYPNDRENSFRFPVIPDTDLQIASSDQDQQSKTFLTNRVSSDSQVKQISNPNYSGLKRTRELDEVPAFMRRRRPFREHESAQPEWKETDTNSAETSTEEKEVKTKGIEILPHTKPDELDAIFKKRDGKLQENEDYPVLFLDKDDTVVEQEPIESEEEKSILHVSPQPEETQSAELEKITEQEVPKEPLKEIAAAEPVKEKVAEKAAVEENISSMEKSAPQQQTKPQSKQEVRVKRPPRPPEISKEPSPSIPEYLLNDHPNEAAIDEDWLIEQQILLEDTFTHFNIDATVVNVTQGPSVTRFEIQPALGVKVSKIKNLSDDLKLNLAAKDIRIEAPIPGRNTIGIEIPNKTMHLVNLQELFEAESFKHAVSPLTIALGLTIEGEPIITNIDKMPHGLIAGATGSGKSVCINTIILSLLYKADHRDVKLLLVDPKMVELTPYNNIPHLIAPVITDVKAATKALKWAVDEMEDRYHKFVELGVRNIQKFNEKVKHGESSYEKMPYMVIIIDELADLMMVSPQEVEDAICRIAQKARACGIHLLLATQRPSVDVITGLIKANIPTRIAFSVSSQVDSRTMIDSNGAEKLLGKGDMLFVENGAGKAVRLQGPFVSDDEIERVASYVRSIAEPEYLFEQEQLLTYEDEEEADELLGDVISFVVTNGQASTSLLQRQFRIGYNRAARLIDSLEAKGIISGQNGSKPREVLVTEDQIEYV